MNSELELLWKQPTFENLDRGVRSNHDDNFARLHGLFVHLLFSTSDALPMKASPGALKLATARKVVWAYHREAEAAWQGQGFITKWSPDCLEGMAREMGDKLARHPVVVNAVAEKLEKRRDEVFADFSLTHNDALFSVYSCVAANQRSEIRNIFDEINIVEIKEPAIETITRSIDHLEDLRSTSEFKRFIRIRRILYSLVRVYAVVHDD